MSSKYENLPKDRWLVQEALKKVALGPEGFSKWVKSRYDEFDTPFFNLLRKMGEYTEKPGQSAELNKTFRFLETCFQKMFDLDGEYGSIIITEDNYKEYWDKASQYLQTDRARHAIPVLEALSFFFKQTSKSNKYIGSLHSNLGTAYAQVGSNLKALKNLFLALEIAKKNNSHDLAMILSNIAMVHGAMGKHKEALDYHNQALEISRQQGRKDLEIKHLSNLAIANMDSNSLEEAIKNQTEALKIAQDINDKRAISDGMARMGLLCAFTGNLEEAKDLCSKALDINSKNPFSGGE
ncbi:tetratricopeptide repeat protein [Candidatus Uabimicrobium sp. HlEnr_7]|uniref:tetratricopeptide repeat protein n=1 Tax=Candidatus Uabimicrobium helgolandensis TaxID=3095367 RepID=UPI0035590EF2